MLVYKRCECVCGHVCVRVCVCMRACVCLYACDPHNKKQIYKISMLLLPYIANYLMWKSSIIGR